MMIKYNPASFCRLTSNELHSKILNDLSVIPVANIITANIPRNNIFISNKTFLKTGINKIPAMNIFKCIALHHLLRGALYFDTTPNGITFLGELIL
ncbi:MAG TPA: hypothetical protein VFI29_11030 [Hanamia sp.]|nr:hypothetical protein [Hanamia sp.]